MVLLSPPNGYFRGLFCPLHLTSKNLFGSNIIFKPDIKHVNFDENPTKIAEIWTNEVKKKEVIIYDFL